MNLKHALVMSAFLIAGSTAFAQTGNLKKAKTNIAKFEELKGAGSLELALPSLKSAQEAINAAVVHEKTKELAETWTYASLVNANLASIEKSAAYAQTAKEAIEKAKALDTDKVNAANINVAEQLLGQYNFNLGVGFWEGQDFPSAYKAFDAALNYLPGDSTLTYYSGLAALQSKDYANAIKKYNELVPVKEFSSHKSIVVDLPKLYMSIQDTAAAIAAAEAATVAYPSDNDAAVQFIEYNLITGNEQKVIDKITSQMAKDPSNKALPYYLGIAYNTTKDFDKAGAAFQKAVDLDPSYFEANTNLAISIMSNVRETLNKANNDRSLKAADYNAIVAKSKEDIKRALPYLEKAVSLQPTNVDALTNLKNYYDFMQNEAKSNELKAKIESL
ncbi:tetratricopeptide repeat protein [Sphingobacteriaceae bacterium WQ 2009]|uniref:Tetratricopeptide repeat protein n=1 Tax=Rhinopithecimicrobium faecis TaxID=2820698 RepID=A0A8T4HCH0_9SPHI|nr:tetratricopeptide repeat protein [Sphingobacteriaceae bacterium WQ 2009]